MAVAALGGMLLISSTHQTAVTDEPPPQSESCKANGLGEKEGLRSKVKKLIRPERRDAVANEPPLRSEPAGASGPDKAEIVKLAKRLSEMVEAVGSDEFGWQEAHYEHDSRQGRELLFLIANHEWVRATSEIVDITRSDVIETTIKIDIDLSLITHEAFRGRTGRLWLPVTVLPPQALEAADEPVQAGPAGRRRCRLLRGRRKGAAKKTVPAGPDADLASQPGRAGRRHVEPDPFATVTDAAGNLLPMLPAADLRHQISAAMAEIIVKMAVSHRDHPEQVPPVATRDQRLLLSAAIYRMLGYSSEESSDPAGSQLVQTTRIGAARKELLPLLRWYISLLREPEAVQGAGARKNPQFAPELVRRAVKILQALSESLIVVVPVDGNSAPTVLTVRVPTRTLRQAPGWNWREPETWRIRPSGRLSIDVLLPTADADRQIQVNLPDGISLAQPASMGEPPGAAQPALDITVNKPPSLHDLSASIKELVAAEGHSSPVSLTRAFADLTRMKLVAALDTLRHYKVDSASGGPPTPADKESRLLVEELFKKPGQPDAMNEPSAASLDAIRLSLEPEGQPPRLSRHTLTDSLSPQTVVARADMIEDVSQRAIPSKATITVDVMLDDRDYFAVARSSARMSLVLMAGVLLFVVGWALVNPRATTPRSAEVLAIVLTLFATIQASRFERADRSTLRGELSAIGSWLIAGSMLPPLMLAVVFAFNPAAWVAAIWAAASIVLQMAVRFFMKHGPLTPAGWPSTGQYQKPGGRRGAISAVARATLRVALLLPFRKVPLTSGGWPAIGRHRDFSTSRFDYRHFEALRADYWRITTAEALMIGRMAYGYVIWQKADPGSTAEGISPKLMPLLKWKGAAEAATEPSSVLALLRSGTLGQAVTFIVFRGKPDKRWRDGNEEYEQPKDIGLDPGHLAPADSVTGTFDVFVGICRDEMPRIIEHPLVIILKAAANKLIVLNVQLPVPAPVAGHDDRQWARIRLALRDAEDIGRLAGFLRAINEEMLRLEGGGHVIAVRAVPTVRPRVDTEPDVGETPADHAESVSPVLTSDLDIISHANVGDEPPDAPTWRVLTICADARSNIESDILERLACVREHFQLRGLTYGLLHGTAVMVLLIHEPAADPRAGVLPDRVTQGKEDRAAALENELRNGPAWGRLRVPIDQQLSRNELGDATRNPCPMLRVRFRWQDQPGALLNMIRSLNEVLTEERPSLQRDDWSVSYASLQVLTGQVAGGWLTIRVHRPAEQISGWDLGKMETMGRKIEALAAAWAAGRERPRSSGAGPGQLEDPVVSIDRIKISPRHPADLTALRTAESAKVPADRDPGDPAPTAGRFRPGAVARPAGTGRRSSPGGSRRWPPRPGSG